MIQLPKRIELIDSSFVNLDTGEIIPESRLSKDYVQLMKEKKAKNLNWDLIPTFDYYDFERTKNRNEAIDQANILKKKLGKNKNPINELFDVSKDIVKLEQSDTPGLKAFKLWMMQATENQTRKIKKKDYWIKQWPIINRNPNKGKKDDFDINLEIKKFM